MFSERLGQAYRKQCFPCLGPLLSTGPLLPSEILMMVPHLGSRTRRVCSCGLCPKLPTPGPSDLASLWPHPHQPHQELLSWRRKRVYWSLFNIGTETGLLLNGSTFYSSLMGLVKLSLNSQCVLDLRTCMCFCPTKGVIS